MRDRLDNTPAHLSSPYGLLRSPWNYNPSPLVTRYGTVFGIANYSSIGLSKDLVFKMHMGVVCDDYTAFFGRVNGKSFETYLLAIENDTHGIFHFTFGGVGGKMARASVKVLMDTFGFTYSNIATLATAAQPFFKKYLALSHSDPVNCTANPWQSGELSTTASPGDIGGPQCDFADHYYDSDDSLNDLIDAFFDIDLDSDDSVVTRLKNMQFEDKTDALKVIGSAFPFDGDLAGSGAGTVHPLNHPFSFSLSPHRGHSREDGCKLAATHTHVKTSIKSNRLTQTHKYVYSSRSSILGGSWGYGTHFPESHF